MLLCILLSKLITEHSAVAMLLRNGALSIRIRVTSQ